MRKDSAMPLIGPLSKWGTNVSNLDTLIQKVTTAPVDTNGRTPPVHSPPELTECETCGRPGARRENGIPAAWRLNVQGELQCPICWGEPAKYAD
jgi:hypothetical protein